MFSKSALLVGLLCCSVAGAAPVGVESSINAVFAEHVRAVQARDLPALESTITSGEQLTLILPNGVQTATRQAYIDFHKEFFATKTWTIQFAPVSRMVGRPDGRLTTPISRQNTPARMPVPSALAQASLAAKRLA